MSSSFQIHPLHYSNAGVFQYPQYPAQWGRHYPLNNLHLPLPNSGAAPLPRTDAPTTGHFGISIYKPAS